MADTTVASDLNVEQWSSQEYLEYVREDPFMQLAGMSPTRPIQIKEQLTKEPGDQVTFPLVTEIDGDGVEDDAELEGNEVSLGNYGDKVKVHQLRQAVVVGKHEASKGPFDMWKAGRKMLRVWLRAKNRDLFIARMFSPNTDGLTTYDATTEADKDTWEATNNATTANQRILFGATKGNQSGDHSADLSNIDGTSDDMHQDIVRLIKRLVQACDPHIRPAEIGGKSDGKNDAGKEGFCLLMGSLAFRDLQSNFETILSNADDRGARNNIFSGGAIRVGNVLCLEVPEMDRTSANGGTLLEDVGDGANTDVAASFLLGAQSLFYAVAKRTQILMDVRDYKNKRGVGIGITRGCKKATFNSFQHGMGTLYTSAVGD